MGGLRDALHTTYHRALGRNAHRYCRRCRADRRRVEVLALSLESEPPVQQVLFMEDVLEVPPPYDEEASPPPYPWLEEYGPREEDLPLVTLDVGSAAWDDE